MKCFRRDRAQGLRAEERNEKLGAATGQMRSGGRDRMDKSGKRPMAVRFFHYFVSKGWGKTLQDG